MSGFKTLLLLIALMLLCARSFTAERPNVILILSDDQRFDTIHALGNDEIRTPNLDRLVERGFAFTHTYIMGSTQPAVCVCSRACLMSGRPLSRAPTDLKEVPLLPRVLAKSGVKTYGIGKWHNGAPSYARAFDDGAAIFFGGMHNHARIPVHPFAKDGKYPKTHEVIGDVFSTELFADKAVDFLKNYRDDAPFFLYVALTAPHDPRTPPGKYKTMYDPTQLSVPKNFLPEHPFNNGELKVRDELLAPFPRTEKVVQQHLADYYGMISHLDEHVGRITAALATSPHKDNTIVIFSADNGLAVGQHGLFGKQSLYEHSIRVPLVIAGPNIPAGKRSPALVYLHDLFATICELQSAESRQETDSQSLLALVHGKVEKGRDTITASYRDVQRMVRRGDLKLIHYPKIDRTQCFDVAKDPWETNDLAKSEEFAKSKEFAELKAALTP